MISKIGTVELPKVPCPGAIAIDQTASGQQKGYP